MKNRSTRIAAAPWLTALLLATTAATAVAQTPPGPTPPTTTPPGTTPPGTTPPGPATPTPTADLSVSLMRDGSKVDEGDRYSWEATIVNNGPGVARNVVIYVSTPEEYDLDDTNQDGECRTDPDVDGRMACYYDVLQPGGEIVLKFRGQFRETGDVHTSVRASAATTDPDPSNDSDRRRVDVQEEEDEEELRGGDFNPCADPTITGTDGDDDILGTTGDDVIDALAGDDTVDAEPENFPNPPGDDIVCGGPGEDNLIPGAGEDEVFGEEGNDIIEAFDNDGDFVNGGPGRDTCFVDDGLDTVVNCEEVIEGPAP